MTRASTSAIILVLLLIFIAFLSFLFRRELSLILVQTIFDLINIIPPSPSFVNRTDCKKEALEFGEIA